MPPPRLFQRSSLASLGRFFRTYWIATAIAVIFVAVVIAWVAGYRLSSGFTVVRVGTLAVVDLPPDAEVYVDQADRGNSSTGSLDLPLVPGTHTVIVSATGAQPWETMSTVAAGKTTDIDPILFPVQPDIEPLSATDTATAKAAIAADTLPTAAAPLILGCTALSVQGNQLIASVASSTAGCTPPAFLCTDGSCAPTIVFSPTSPMHDVLPYPGRTDAVLVTAGDTLYALGLDPRAPQAFSELLSAPDIRAAALAGGAIVAQNATGIYGLEL